MSKLFFNTIESAANKSSEVNAGEHLENGRSLLTHNVSERRQTVKRKAMRRMFAVLMAIIVAGGGVFYACKKDNSNSLTHKSVIDKNDFNWVSDVFLEAFETTLNDFGFGEDTDPEICGSQMNTILQDAIASNGYGWLYDEINAIDEEMLNEEIEYMKMVYQIFFHHSSEDINNGIDNLLDEISFSELKIEQKMRLCIYGKSFIGLNNISNAIALKCETGEIIVIYGDDDDDALYATFNEKWEECMKIRLGAIFEDGNWVDKTMFIAGAPSSILWMSASCIVDVRRGKYDYMDNNYVPVQN